MMVHESGDISLELTSLTSHARSMARQPAHMLRHRRRPASLV